VKAVPGAASAPGAVDRERVLTTLIDLCEIRSPSFSETPVREYVRSAIMSLGLTVDEDRRGNLYVHLPGREDLDPLFLASHMDTVPVPEGASVCVIRENGRIESDKTTILGGDDKQGIAAALEMIRLAVAYPGTHRGIDAIFTVEEEMGSLGSRDVEVDRITARQGYNLDGETPPGTAITRAPRKARYTVTVRGRSSHAALDPERGINAIINAARIVRQLPQGAPDEHSTANVGTISGGHQTNVVPDTATITGEIRSFDEDSFNRLRGQIDTVVSEIDTAGEGSVSVAWEETYNRYEVSPAEPCVRWFSEACTAQGIETAYLTSRGGGDANQLNNNGLTCIVFGLGMHEIHSVDEYVVEDEYLAAVELLRSIVFPM
jgi:tripeptide aminopeptidase